jgi:hypothetical protein
VGKPPFHPQATYRARTVETPLLDRLIIGAQAQAAWLEEGFPQPRALLININIEKEL